MRSLFNLRKKFDVCLMDEFSVMNGKSLYRLKNMEEGGDSGRLMIRSAWKEQLVCNVNERDQT